MSINVLNNAANDVISGKFQPCNRDSDTRALAGLPAN